MTNSFHLSEEERQSLADGTLDGDTRRMADAHMTSCADCRLDVDRLRILMDRTRSISQQKMSNGSDDLWPDIRARIEASKVLAIPPQQTDEVGASAATRDDGPWLRRRSSAWIAAGVAAAIIAAALVMPRARDVQPALSTSEWIATDGPTLIDAADSMRAYAAEATELLNRLELQRAMLPPAMRTSLDHDLRVIDSAIAETRDALTRDPNNPALLRLLASSYRQKVELLKRANGDG